MLPVVYRQAKELQGYFIGSIKSKNKGKNAGMRKSKK
jgi:hypothetical protein